MRLKKFAILIFLSILFCGLWLIAISQESTKSPGRFQEGLYPESESKADINIKWLGQSSFLITSAQNTSILTDPVNFKGYRMPEDLTADVITVSHEHPDHNCVEGVAGSPLVFRGTDTKCRVVNAIDTIIKDVRLYSVASLHTPGQQRANAIFVFEFDKIRIAHLGDIGTVLSADQIKAIGSVDILMVPVGGQYTIAAAEADSIVAQLEVKRLVLPMHYKTEAFPGLPYAADIFLKGKENVRMLDCSEIIFLPTDSASKREYLILQY